MERHLAVVENGVVTRILVVNPEDAVTIDYLGGRLLPIGSPVSLGWTHDGTDFAPPVIVLTPEEEAKKAQQEVDAAALTQAKADATIQYLANHTTAEITAKVRQLVGAAGVTNLATAQASIAAIEDLLVRLAIAVSAGLRKQLR